MCSMIRRQKGPRQQNYLHNFYALFVRFFTVTERRQYGFRVHRTRNRFLFRLRLAHLSVGSTVGEWR